jgi:diguanylate cyclase (GGDEF)-like protein/PAS domain S-box-containing protein
MTANPGSPPLDDLLDDRYLLDALLERSPDHLYFKDTLSRFLRVSRSLAEWMGLSDPMEAIGRSDTDFFAAAHAEKARVDEDVILRTGRALVGIEEREVWPDGRETWVSTTKAPLRDRNGEIIGIFGMSRDITARKAAEELVAAQAAKLAEQAQLLRDLATRDDLTGLLNRRGFFDAAAAAIQHARRSSRRVVMFFVDLDGLKQINDTQGHAAGDRALTAIANALRGVDGPGRVAGRMGGDEFCLLEAVSLTDGPLDEAALQQAIAEAAADAGLSGLSAAVGRVDAEPDDDLAELIARSDDVMYTRKSQRDSR